MEAEHGRQQGVKMGVRELAPAFRFKYLGRRYRADGDRKEAVEVRMGQAADRFRELSRVWGSNEISVELKLRIYVAGVVSVLVYGCECWDLEECTGMIQQWNARRLALISGREIRDEYVGPSVDLLGMVRARRMRWVGEMLRLGEERLLRNALEIEWDQQGESCGGLLRDVPEVDSFSQLIDIASDIKLWKGLVDQIYRKPRRPKRRNEVKLVVN